MEHTAGWREISQDEFFATVGKLDVHPSIQPSRWPYTSLWKTRAGHVRGKTIDYLPEGAGLTKTRYLVPQS